MKHLLAAVTVAVPVGVTVAISVAVAVAVTCCTPSVITQGRRALEAGAQGVVAVDRVVYKLAPADIERAVVEIRDEARRAKITYDMCRADGYIDCGPVPTVELFMAQYEERTRGWRTTVRGLQLLREGLILGEVALDQWEVTKTAPAEDVIQMCGLFAEGMSDTTAGLALANVDVPPEFEAARGVLGPACSFLERSLP
jgi:hypothetical protein